MRIEYHLDAEDRIVAFNDHWTSFALANDGHAVANESVLGQSLWRHIADAGTASIYQRLFERVRRGGHGASFTFRCDSASQRRLFRMNLTPTAGSGIVVHITEEHVETRAPIPLFDVHAKRGAAVVRMCAWCHAVAGEGGTWLELERAIQEMGIFHHTDPPFVTHSICPSCQERIEREIDSLGPVPSA